MTVRKATYLDIPEILPVLDAARGIMRASGNLGQWVGGYPSEEAIRTDIQSGVGYVVLEDKGLLVGYFAFIPSPEPTYACIYGGNWLDDSLPYHVIHRIGSTPWSHGVFSAILQYCFERENNIRIDTHRDNHIMQHLLERHSFSYCGIIYLVSGDERLAYQRIQTFTAPSSAD